MDYRGIDFDLRPVRPGTWNYRFLVGRAINRGRIKAADQFSAILSIQKKINRQIRLKRAIEPSPSNER
jgi:hypothetical protein